MVFSHLIDAALLAAVLGVLAAEVLVDWRATGLPFGMAVVSAPVSTLAGGIAGGAVALDTAQALIPAGRGRARDDRAAIGPGADPDTVSLYGLPAGARAWAGRPIFILAGQGQQQSPAHMGGWSDG
jgi:hypothetical protein